MIYTYAYPRPALTVDIIILKKVNNSFHVLLIERKNEPFKNQWALPGGFVDIDEEIDEAAYRELKEETSISEIKLYQFYTFGKIGRDPRGRTISIVYHGLLENEKQEIKAGDDAKNLRWFPIENLPEIAFDHLEIMSKFLLNKKSSL
ncbi:MAG TPA: NUDIX hydrolase [Bacteroidales bacterium]|nr:NUDIX hydrolase [Bacteroidales bacterium]